MEHPKHKQLHRCSQRTARVVCDEPSPLESSRLEIVSGLNPRETDITGSQEVTSKVLGEMLGESLSQVESSSHVVSSSPIWNSTERTPSPLVAVRQSSPSSAGNCSGRFCLIQKAAEVRGRSQMCGFVPCSSRSQYRCSGFCRATKPNYQFFRAGGSSGTSCPSGSQYKGNGFCLAR